VSVLEQIGRVSLGGAALELRASLLAASALGLPQRIGIFLFGRENASRSFQRAREALQAAPDCEGRGVALEWIADAQTQYTRRNQILHGVVADRGDGTLARMSLSGSLSGPAFSEEVISIEEIAEMADALTAVNEHFDSVVTTVLIRDLPFTRAALGHPPA
jgi:hypothetical protein